ncbi:hypothetical protein ACQPXB_21245 [Amycolatopsis sp. CA-161197]|uniref:hypothetical protein n=1 Tax=Amycolatopsis sp. CA-161197 TaxID=3239922 RepID=UPI003D8B3155
MAQLKGHAVLLADTADPARSGLARATRSDGSAQPGPRATTRMRFSWRAQALVARAETAAPALEVSGVPSPSFWLPAGHRVGLTVVDVAWDAWRLAVNPALGPGAWLAPFPSGTHPVLVVRASVPGVVHAEQVLARFEQWSRHGQVVLPQQLVVIGVRKWPGRVLASAGPRMQALMPAAVFVPSDSGAAVDGVTAAVTPDRLRRPMQPLIDCWLQVNARPLSR